MQKPFGHRDSQDAVIGDRTALVEEGKLLVLGRCPLVNRPHEIAYDRAEHDGYCRPIGILLEPGAQGLWPRVRRSLPESCRFVREIFKGPWHMTGEFRLPLDIAR